MYVQAKQPTITATLVAGSWTNVTDAPDADQKIVVLGLWLIGVTFAAATPQLVQFNTSGGTTVHFWLQGSNSAADLSGPRLDVPFFCTGGARLRANLLASTGDCKVACVYGQIREDADFTL